jgi:hypothetical protein
MNPEAQRIAIAEACGAKWRRFASCAIIRLTFKDSDDSVECEKPSRVVFSNTVPDYTNSLDAMHEAEETLTDHQRMLMYHAITKILRRHKSELPAWRSTAPQRAEAFLKTLGKWKDGV